MKYLALLICLGLAGCYQTPKNTSPYLALSPQLHVDYSVYVATGHDKPCELEAYAKDLCKGFSLYYIQKAPKMSDEFNAYLIECTQ